MVACFGATPSVGSLAVRRRVDHGGMTDPELIRRAEAAGITTSYENWQGKPVDVSAETLEALLAALATPDSPSASPSLVPAQAGPSGEPVTTSQRTMAASPPPEATIWP